MPDDTLTTEEAAHELSLTANQIRQRIRRGQLDAHKDEGGYWRITRESVEQLKDKRWRRVQQGLPPTKRPSPFRD